MRIFIFLASLVIAVLAQGSINIDADPFYIEFSKNDSIGPDGPWLYIPQAIDYPDQFVNMLPALTKLSLVIADDACAAQSAVCPLPIPTLWEESGAWAVSGGDKTISSRVPASHWDEWAAELLRMQGFGKHFQNRITLHANGDINAPAFLDNHGMQVSTGYKATFPGENLGYTLDTGFLSLYGGEETVTWTASTNGSRVTFNRTLPDAYLAGYIPSVSYGLHVGSATHGIHASLYVGGYDSSRCIGEPIVSDLQSVLLTAITLGVASGGSAYIDAPSPSTNLLEGGESSDGGSIAVVPNPAVPYLYLPKDTCDAIAAHLPVTYSEDFNLYLWNDNDDYQSLVSSPHYLAFTFQSSDGRRRDINIPFALLDLTLDQPLVPEPTKYFPCSPWTFGKAPYTLGRAFLQGAYLAQNWQTNKLFLAQAPGPELYNLPPYVRTIETEATSLAPATNPPDWADTWSGTLRALPNDYQAPGSGGSGGSGGSSDSNGLSGGVIAGIVVGVVGGIALVVTLIIFVIWRRRKSAREPEDSRAEMSDTSPSSPTGHQSGSVYAYRKEQQPQPQPQQQQQQQPMYEADNGHPPAEMDSRTVGELPAEYKVDR